MCGILCEILEVVGERLHVVEELCSRGYDSGGYPALELVIGCAVFQRVPVFLQVRRRLL